MRYFFNSEFWILAILAMTITYLCFGVVRAIYSQKRPRQILARVEVEDSDGDGVKLDEHTSFSNIWLYA